MVYYLRKTKRVIRGQAKVTLVTRILKVAVETGLLCAAVVTLGLILYVSFPHTSWYIFPAITASKLYSNSLLAVSHLKSFSSTTDSPAGFF